MSRITDEVVAAVHERAANHCEACGLVLVGTVDLHHRKLRAQGGENSAVNLIFVHRDCHLRIHRNPSLAYEHGLMVHRGEDPAKIEICLVPGLYR
jgi:hypothetical protein